MQKQTLFPSLSHCCNSRLTYSPVLRQWYVIKLLLVYGHVFRKTGGSVRKLYTTILDMLHSATQLEK